jgi:hypothetical protein
MSDVFRNIDPPPLHRPASVYPPPRLWCGGGEDTLTEWRGGGGSVVLKTPDTALYSIYVSTLWKQVSIRSSAAPIYTLYSILRGNYTQELGDEVPAVE